MSTTLKTLSIKARVYNQIRVDLYKKRIDQISSTEKIEFFNKIFNLNVEAHNELNAYKQKRKDKKEIYEARVKRGYKFKKKISKEEYQKINLENIN